MFTLESQIRLPAPVDEVWPFFSDARNLERLTPALLRFEFLTQEPIEMTAGTLLDYKLRVRGIPIRWRSRIAAWEPPVRFVDEQVRGPYRCWVHEHTFEGDGDATIARDRVVYDHFGGRLVNRLLVAPDLCRIFAYRSRVLESVFAGVGPVAETA